MKTISVNGKRYRLSWSQHWNRVEMRGPGLLGGVFLVGGVTLHSPADVLRDAASVAITEYRQRHKAAVEHLQKSMEPE